MLRLRIRVPFRPTRPPFIRCKTGLSWPKVAIVIISMKRFINSHRPTHNQQNLNKSTTKTGAKRKTLINLNCVKERRRSYKKDSSMTLKRPSSSKRRESNNRS